jgi:hypothetical protein
VAAATGTPQVCRISLACVHNGEVGAAPILEIGLALQLEAQAVQR